MPRTDTDLRKSVAGDELIGLGDSASGDMHIIYITRRVDMFALDITSLHISVLCQFSDELCRMFPEWETYQESVVR